MTRRLTYIPLICLLLVCGANPAQAETTSTDMTWPVFAGPLGSLARILSLMPAAPPPPAWIRHAEAAVAVEDRALIAIVIDDLGLDRKRSDATLDLLPAPVTMAYLPYARDLQTQTARARAKGHELLVHMPMAPQRKSANPGPDYLGPDMPPEEIRARVQKNLSAFDEYAGVNNHMGSGFTCCAEVGLNVLMEELAARGLMFLDSKTISTSIAEKTARAHGVPTTSRDVFLDDEDTAVFTADALKKTEHVARRTGSAIVIGHPRDITLQALTAWIPTLEEKGLRLAPLSQVLQRRAGK